MTAELEIAARSAKGSARPVARLQGVSHRFGDFQVLSDVCLQINAGDVYGLLGLNGAGKTTALRAMLGLLKHDDGEIELFGKSASSHWLEVAPRIGATIEGPAFYPNLDGLTNLELLYDLGGAEGGMDAAEALDVAGLSHVAKVQSRKYSQGMLQRLYIAQALLGSPDLLVLDEPTSNLDPQGILAVRQLIQRLNREHGITVLLSSHQLAEVEDLCTRVAILHKGKCIVEATVRDLFDVEECWVEIEVDRLEEARVFLEARPECEDVSLCADRVRVRVAREGRASLNAALHREGFAVSQLIERRPSLEDYFHKAISEDAS